MILITKAEVEILLRWAAIVDLEEVRGVIPLDKDEYTLMDKLKVYAG